MERGITDGGYGVGKESPGKNSKGHRQSFRDKQMKTSQERKLKRKTCRARGRSRKSRKQCILRKKPSTKKML